jgi:hypothetical protein
MLHTPWDGLDIPVLYMFMGWTRSFLIYMSHSVWDGLGLPSAICTSPMDELDLDSAICTTLHGMDLISLVLYALFFKGWT